MPFTYALNNNAESSTAWKKYAEEWNKNITPPPPVLTPEMIKSVSVYGESGINESPFSYDEHHNFLIQVASERRYGEKGLVWYGYKRFDRVFGFGVDDVPIPDNTDGALKICKTYPLPLEIKAMEDINYNQLIEEVSEALLIASKTNAAKGRYNSFPKQVILAEEVL